MPQELLQESAEARPRLVLFSGLGIDGGVFVRQRLVFHERPERGRRVRLAIGRAAKRLLGVRVGHDVARRLDQRSEGCSRSDLRFPATASDRW